MSLFLTCEEMWDRPMGASFNEKHVPHWVGNVIFGFLVVLFKICFRYRVDNRENLRGFHNESGVLIVANHTSFLDVLCMYLAGRPTQWVRFLGRANLFKDGRGFGPQVLTRVGSFPIKRDTADRVALKRAATMLKRKEIVGILPEGTRRGKGSKTPELHSGAAFIAKMGNVPILPMTVRNAELVKQKGKWLRFPKITIEYGNPLLLRDFDFLPREDRLDGCTWYAMRECFSLFMNVPREQVDMLTLFPDGRDFTEIFAGHALPEHTTTEIVADLRAARSATKAVGGGSSVVDVGSELSGKEVL